MLAKPFSDPVTVTSPLAARLPRTYLAFTERDRSNPAYIGVAAVAARVQEWGWPIIALPYDHNGHRSHPDEVAAVLNQLMAGQTVVEPSEAGPLQVGTVMRMPAARTTQPGAFSVTWIETATATEQETVSGLTHEILGDLQQDPGFLGWTGGTVGGRQFTVTAWARPEDAEAAMARGAHRKAMQLFFDPAFQGAEWTSVWVPHRLNPLWVLCTACGTRRRAAQGSVCECGAPLPTFPYW